MQIVKSDKTFNFSQNKSNICDISAKNRYDLQAFFNEY